MSKKKKSKPSQPSAQQSSSGDKTIKSVYGSTIAVIGAIALMIAAIMTECGNQSPMRATQTIKAGLAKMATPTHTATITPKPTNTPTQTVTVTPTITVKPTIIVSKTPRPLKPTPRVHPPIEPDLVFVEWSFMRLYNEFKKVYEGCALELAPYEELSRTYPLRDLKEREVDPFICLVPEQGDAITTRTPCIKKLNLCSDEEGSEAPCDTHLSVFPVEGFETSIAGFPPMTYLGDFLIFYSVGEPMWCESYFYAAAIPSSKIYLYEVLLTGDGINEKSCEGLLELMTGTPSSDSD